MWYSTLADIVVAIHVAYVGFVVAGLLAIWIGAALKRQFIRNFWFRSAHLLAIGYVALEAATNMVCPLTKWERELRTLAGESTRAGSFMGRLFHDLIFLDLPESAFDYMHIGFAAIVLATMLLWPPRLPQCLVRRLRRSTPATSVKE